MTFHNSGVPVYLHRESRVVTWSRPYFLGTGSIRVGAASVLHVVLRAAGGGWSPGRPVGASEARKIGRAHV